MARAWESAGAVSALTPASNTIIVDSCTLGGLARCRQVLRLNASMTKRVLVGGNSSACALRDRVPLVRMAGDEQVGPRNPPSTMAPPCSAADDQPGRQAASCRPPPLQCRSAPRIASLAISAHSRTGHRLKRSHSSAASAMASASRIPAFASRPRGGTDQPTPTTVQMARPHCSLITPSSRRSRRASHRRP